MTTISAHYLGRRPPKEDTVRLVRLVTAGAVALLLAAVTAVVTSTPAQAAVWSSSDRWGTWSSGGYTLYNNVWGSGYGPQTITANSPSNWWV
jgi:hypothetical protein